MISISMLRAIAGGDPDQSNMASVIAGLAEHGPRLGLDRPHRLAHYLPQLAHESGRFRYDREIWGSPPTAAQRRYEDRADLGHSAAIPGEAFLFRGHTAMQITGRYNTRRFRDWTRAHLDPDAPDFEADPDLMNRDPWEGIGPLWYWEAGNPEGRSLSRYADANNIEAVTRKINGGLNGYADRLELYSRAALILLGYPLTPGAILRFQKDAGFPIDDLDGIAGAQTRTAMHRALVALAPLAATPGALEATPPPKPATDKPQAPGKPQLWPARLGIIRSSLAQAALDLEAIQAEAEASQKELA